MRMLTVYAVETNHVFLSPSQKAAVAALDPKDREDIPDVLKIVIGMPCTIIANIATMLAAANGSRGDRHWHLRAPSR